MFLITSLVCKQEKETESREEDGQDLASSVAQAARGDTSDAGLRRGGVRKYHLWSNEAGRDTLKGEKKRKERREN